MEIRARSVLDNPSASELRDLSAAQPSAHPTEYGNLDVITTVTARSKGSTFIVSDAAQEHTDPVISRDRYNALAKTQDEFIAQRDMVVLDGYIGDHPTARMRARLIVERSNANLAAMQRLLYFPADDSAEPGAHSRVHPEPSGCRIPGRQGNPRRPRRRRDPGVQRRLLR